MSRDPWFGIVCTCLSPFVFHHDWFPFLVVILVVLLLVFLLLFLWPISLRFLSLGMFVFGHRDLVFYLVKSRFRGIPLCELSLTMPENTYGACSVASSQGV